MSQPLSRDRRDEQADDVFSAMTSLRTGNFGPGCPVDRLPRRRRNQICITIIAIGLANFVAYTLSYALIGGDAHNGHIERIQDNTGAEQVLYKVRGHFIHSPQGREHVVSRSVWIYSYVHSISVPLISGAMIISMLVLARPHIVATMRGGLVNGRMMIAIFGWVVGLIAGGATVLFTWQFIDELPHG